jgi:two-component system chemotaxis sensor kinase CheA
MSSLNDLKSQLLGAFFEESAEAAELLEAGLLKLEAGFDAVVVDEVFRAAHSIKGGAGTFGFAEVGALAHDMETLLDQIRAGTRPPSPDTMGLLLEGVDALRDALVARREGRAVAADGHAALRQRVQILSASPVAPAVAAAPTPAPAEIVSDLVADLMTSMTWGWKIAFRPRPHLLESGNEPWRLVRELESLGNVSVEADLGALPSLLEMVPSACYLAWNITLVSDAPRAAIEDVFSWVAEDAQLSIEELRATADARAPEELSALTAAVAASSSPASPQPSTAPPPAVGAGHRDDHDVALASLRVGIDKIDALMNMVGELVITQSMLGGLDDAGPFDDARLARLREGLSQLARNSRALQESVMRLRSVPVSVVFNRFPRLVHDLSRHLGKRVELAISGQNTELDKTVLEKLGDPLVHLVRNSLDHGFEMPDERAAAGKPPCGRLGLSAFHRGGDIVVEVEDDGRGLDTDRILRKARERGIVPHDVTPSPREIAELIFSPGFSTAEVVTDVSGRGVGMDVVRRNVRSLGGDIDIESVRGRGTKITLHLPLTLAIIDGQLVGVGEHSYVVPLLTIVESVQIASGRLKSVAGGGVVYRVRDQLVPVVDLVGILGGTPSVEPLEGRLLVLVEADGRRVGLLVDELQGQQQVVIKSLETNCGRIEGLAGATILGDGSVAFILDMVGLVRLARQGTRAARDVGGSGDAIDGDASGGGRTLRPARGAAHVDLS